MDKPPIIVLFVGVPGSGKTTFARQLADKLQAIILNSDAVRMAMWGSLEAIQATHQNPEERKAANGLTFGAMNYAAQQALAAGVSVIYDCNANHIWERQEKHDIAKEQGAVSVVVRIRVPYDTSLIRVQQREESHDQRRISPEKARKVLDRFVAEIEEPTAREKVIEIDGGAPFDEQYQAFIRSFEDTYGQAGSA